jgi:hypothetical protein
MYEDLVADVRRPIAGLAQAGIFAFMADAEDQLLSATTPATDGGAPSYSAVIVAEPDPRKAEQLIRESASHNEAEEAIRSFAA